MSRYVLDLPDSCLDVLGTDREHAVEVLRLAAAMKYYEMGKLSAGAAAEFAGISVPVFLTRLSDFDIEALRQTPEDLRAELDAWTE